jgi:hypothetical protein
MPMLITSIRRRVMPFARLMNTSLNIMNSAHLMTQMLCDSRTDLY